MIRGTKRPAPKALKISDVEHLNANLNINIHNRFDVEVIDAKSGKVKQKAQAENVICNQLWTRLLTPQTYFNYIHYGTGNGTPAATDTSLFTFLGYGSISSTEYAYNWDQGYISVRRQTQLSETTAVGATLTEVGIGHSTSAASLCTHAMLKDMNGNQVSIAKTATDIINIYATVFVHFSLIGHDSGYIKILKTTRNFWLKFLAMGGTDNGLATLRYTMGGINSFTVDSSSFYYQSNLSTVYDTANKQIIITATRIPAASGNLLGLQSVRLGRYDSSNNYYDVAIALLVGGAWFTGSNVVGEAIGTGDGSTKDFATVFPFVQNGAKIYLNGSEQITGVNLDIDSPLLVTNLGVYFEWLPENGLKYDETAEPTFANFYYSSGLGPVVYFNPNYTLGVTSYKGNTSSTVVEVSNDLENWVTLSTGSSTYSVPLVYQHYKYWRVSSSSGTTCGVNTVTTDAITNKNIHFDTAPASGAIITADYTTRTIAKDVGHVFDLTITITLGEYTE